MRLMIISNAYTMILRKFYVCVFPEDHYFVLDLQDASGGKHVKSFSFRTVSLRGRKVQ